MAARKRGSGRPKASRLAKLSAPRMARVLLRLRLFRRLDPPRQAPRQRRVLWVVAPPGAGKTALVASWLRSRHLRHLWIQLDSRDGDVATFFHYLSLAARKRVPLSRLPGFTPEFLASPGGFARLFLRSLCAGSKSPAVVVLDDYHEIRSDSPLHAALGEGFLELPDGVTALVLSRSEPPASLARLQANGLLEVLGGDELALTKHEAAQIVRLWGYSGRARKTVLSLYAQTEGWVAGLVMLLSSWRRRPGVENHKHALFNYLAQEVLERSDPDTRRVLTEAAILPHIEGRIAVRLTGVERAEEILARLARQGSFVVRQDLTFRYHDLFREFLLARLKKDISSPEQLREIRRRAGALLEESGEVENAFELYADAQAWEEAATLVRRNAPPLLRQGRAETVARWIARLPDERRADDPWLLLWAGRAHVFGEPDQAQKELERSFELFRVAGDASGTYLALAAIAEVHFFRLEDFSPLDAWIAKLKDVRRQFPTFPDREVELQIVVAAFTAMVHRQPWCPALREWEERALTLALEPGDLGNRWKVGRALLIPYSFWGMDMTRARLLAETFRPLSTAKHADPASAILWHLACSTLELFVAHWSECLDLAARGLAIAAESGLHAWTPSLLSCRGFTAILSGDISAAGGVIEMMAEACVSAPRLSRCAFHYMATMTARAQGNQTLAQEHARLALDLARAAGSPLAETACQLAWALAQAPEDAELECALQLARRCGMRTNLVATLLRLTLLRLSCGKEQEGLELLREGLRIAKTMGMLSVTPLFPAEVSECCALALEHGIEPDYVKEIIRGSRLEPGLRARDLAQWPWEIRIEALDGFVVKRDGRPLESGRKAQKKPQEMLKLLVARGPGGMGRGALGEALWPQAEGDADHQALKMTLHRLRALLHSADAVSQRDGRISLVPERVFVDVWALDRLLDRLESGRTSTGERKAIRTRLREYSVGRDRDSDDEDAVLRDLRGRLRGRIERALVAGD